MLPWLVLLVIAAIGGGVIWKLAPSPAAPVALAPPPAAAPTIGLDSIAALERALQEQLAEARRIALEAERRAEASGRAPAPGGLPPGLTRDARGNPQVDWPAVISALGFDPRAVDPRRLAPEQRLKYRKFQAWADSLRRTARRP